MQTITGPKGLSRRQLLSRGVMTGVGLVVGAGFVAGRDAAWATEMNAMKPDSFATLVQMARDIYPHDRIPDAHYVTAVKDYDQPDNVDMAEAGIRGLNAAARNDGYAAYLDIGWEADRVAVLRRIEATDFFQTVRGGLITGLYNQKKVWPYFGYPGASFPIGGYLHNGFDDIAWL